MSSTLDSAFPSAEAYQKRLPRSYHFHVPVLVGCNDSDILNFSPVCTTLRLNFANLVILVSSSKQPSVT